MLTNEERQVLLVIARDAISAALTGRHVAPQTISGGSLSLACGAFVTIRLDSELRGCIGYIESEKPLAGVVAEVAAKAATEDSRFRPVTSAEFQRISIEISVLSPLRKIAALDEIIVGTHGLVIAWGLRRGLLLPQVAAEHHLDRDAFLEATMKKAGIPLSMLRQPEVEVFVFEADVFHETDVLP